MHSPKPLLVITEIWGYLSYRGPVRERMPPIAARKTLRLRWRIGKQMPEGQTTMLSKR
jgi:hypothetical protein